MKLQIDTIAKTIKIEEKVNLGEFVEKIEILFPDGQWKEYNLEVAIINNWVNPIIIDRSIPFVYPAQPFWKQPDIICSVPHTGSINVQL
jgi:hypothetical protein